MTDLVQQIRAHAEANWGIDGWDYIVETQTDKELAALIDSLVEEGVKRTFEEIVPAIIGVTELWRERDSGF